MIIGLTYDLRSSYLDAGFSEQETAEFDRSETIDAIQQALEQLGHVTDRIGNARQLVARLGRGDRWDCVFNIAEGLRGIAREAQVPAILDLFQIPYTFSDPLVMAVALHKGHTKSLVREAGIPTADFAVLGEVADVAKIALPYPLFAKPVAEGTGKGVSPTSKVHSPEELRRVTRSLLTDFSQPVLVESYLPGREFTVGITGEGDNTQVLGSLEIVLLPSAEAEVYSYVNKERCEELVDYRFVSPTDPVVAQAERLARRAWIALGCRDAGRIDMRCNAAGEPCFLELNPLAGLHPEHSDLPMLCTRIGMEYRELIRCIIEATAARIRPLDQRLAALDALDRQAAGTGA